MALTPSKMLPLGTPAPDFTLPDVVSNQPFTFSKLPPHQGYLVMFLCKHCPYVIHVQDEITRLAKEFQGQSIAFVAISSNDIRNYPEDAPEKLKFMASQLGWKFPYCYDETQEVAKSFDAACTPDFYLFDAKRLLVYRGQLDDSRPGNGKPVTGLDLRSALKSVVSGRPVNSLQKPSMGCNIKWK